jgi:hypothetical protein
MHHLIGRHRTRRIASVMLFVWLSAVLTSWANACLVSSPGELAHGAVHHLVAGAAQGTTSASQSPAADHALAACEDFCEMERSVVAQAQTKKGLVDTTFTTLILQAADVSWPAIAIWRNEPRRHWLAHPPSSGPSLTIAFLRLTR